MRDIEVTIYSHRLCSLKVTFFILALLFPCESSPSKDVCKMREQYGRASNIYAKKQILFLILRAQYEYEP